jgi:cyclomaltodextrinase / maltogenic alpha-amylase / neopullulanase
MNDQFKTPQWVKDAIFYQIFPDRFARSKHAPRLANMEEWDTPPTMTGFKGGDLAGVQERLDYLQDLGVTALYLNPIFQSTANHRYHTHDYYHIDPLLGGDKSFKNLLKESHRRGMHIVLDGVFNHASRGFFPFNHILENGASSPYFDWFDIKGFPLNAYSGKPNYRSWNGLAALPEFNTDNSQVREFIFGVARYWIEQGIDGWRLDVPDSIDDDSFWQEFRQVVKTANPQAYLVGEISTEAQRWLRGDQFDGVMNYQFAQACLGFFGGKRINHKVEEGMMGLPPTQVLDAASFAQRAEQLLNLYPYEASLAQLNLLDSHDMPRFLSLAGEDKDSLRLASLFQMTYPGAPCIYYGDEIGLSSGATRKAEAARAGFHWQDQHSWDYDLRKYYQDLIVIRKQHPALRSGDFVTLYAEGDVLAYMRRSEDERFAIVINNGDTSYPLDIPAECCFPDGAYLSSQIGCQDARMVNGRITRLALEPRSGIILGRG